MIESDELLSSVAVALTEGEMEAIRVHEFELDGDEHDDAAVAELLESFRANFASAVATLTAEYGQPSRSGSDSEDDAIPLSGLFEFAVWDSPGGSFFLAISHEDRGAPMLLMVGPAE